MNRLSGSGWRVLMTESLGEASTLGGVVRCRFALAGTRSSTTLRVCATVGYATPEHIPVA